MMREPERAEFSPELDRELLTLAGDIEIQAGEFVKPERDRAGVERSRPLDAERREALLRHLAKG